MTSLNLSIPPVTQPQSIARQWLQYLNVAVLKRSLVLMLIIGIALTVVTQFAALFGKADIQRLSLALSFVTPFIVVTTSQLGATHKALSDARQGQSFTPDTSLVTTVLAHGILTRALVIALIVGSLNSLLIFASAFYQTGDISSAPTSLIAQVYLLPFIFGTLSQALTYRRVSQNS